MKEITRREAIRILGVGFLGSLVAVCGGGDNPNLKTENEGRKTSVAYAPVELFIPKETVLRTLPKDDAPIINEHLGFYIFNAIAIDPTGKAYKKRAEGGNDDNLWLGFPYKEMKYWVKWESIKDIDGFEADENLEILFGEPGEKPDEIKVGKANLKILVFPRN